MHPDPSVNKIVKSLMIEINDIIGSSQSIRNKIKTLEERGFLLSVQMGLVESDDMERRVSFGDQNDNYHESEPIEIVLERTEFDDKFLEGAGIQLDDFFEEEEDD